MYNVCLGGVMVKVSIDGEVVKYKFGIFGRYYVMNSVGVLFICAILGLFI